MIRYIIYLIFIIPVLIFSGYIIQFFFIIFLILILGVNINLFFRNLRYNIGLDLLSYILIFIRIYITILIIISSINLYNLLNFIICCLILCFFLIIVFSFLNILIIYLIFESTLIPLIVLILNWGYQPERLNSGFYLFFYTLFGSLPLLVLILYLYIYHDLIYFNFNCTFKIRFLINFLLIFAFMIKLPLFIIHFWLPQAHVQAPVSGSIILAGVILKVGIYGIIRFIIINEYLFYYYSYIWYSLGIIGSIIVSIICFVQRDIKCLIAYSSVCHINLCLARLITITKIGLLRSIFIIISHGFCSSGLFFIVNIIYNRTYSRRFFINKGLINFLPYSSLIIFILCIFNISCPPRLNFIGEILVYFRCLIYWDLSYILLILISFFRACFCYFLYRYRFHGNFINFYSFTIVYIWELLIIFIHIFILIFILIFLKNFYLNSLNKNFDLWYHRYKFVLSFEKFLFKLIFYFIFF